MSVVCVKAIFEKTVFYNPDNTFTVLQARAWAEYVPVAARKGNICNDQVHFVAAGEGIPRNTAITLELVGEWKAGKYGLQLKVSRWREVIVHTPAAIQAYLGCGLIKGVGEKTAEAIVSHFGADALDILEQQPERLLEVRGITPGRLEEIRTSYEQHKDIQELMTFLAPFGVTARTAYKIQEKFGNQSMKTIREDPYALCSMSGFAFKRVDEIARKTGCPVDAPVRIRGALLQILWEARKEKGHLFLKVKTLCNQAVTLLNEVIPLDQRLKADRVSDELYLMAVEKKVVATEGVIYLAGDYEMEAFTADRIGWLLTQHIEPVDIDRVLRTVMKELGVTLGRKQELAVRMVFQHGMSIITGGPGTGKTTVLKVILGVYKAICRNGEVKLCAPTGRASRRMAESTGFNEAQTLHKALGLFPEDELKARPVPRRALSADLMIVDEGSMIDMWLAGQLFGRIKAGARVVLVGDADQLPSVGPGNVLRELISCGAIPVTVLDEVFRQAEHSRIYINAAAIKVGDDRLLLDDNEFQMVKCEEQTQAAEELVRRYCVEAKKYGTEGVQILSPFRTEGAASAEQLAVAIQEAYNPASPEKKEFSIGSRVFRVGDKVIQTVNKWEISNGDMGIVSDIFAQPGAETVVRVAFPGLQHDYKAGELSAISLAYAITIHKAQGSEYDVILLPILRAHMVQLDQNMLLTAVSRAKRKVILVGQWSALYMSIHRKNSDKRGTLLGARVRAAVEKYQKELGAA